MIGFSRAAISMFNFFPPLREMKKYTLAACDSARTLTTSWNPYPLPVAFDLIAAGSSTFSGILPVFFSMRYGIHSGCPTLSVLLLP